MRPPSMRASSLEIDRPSPVPPYLRLVVPSACWNASKIISSLSRGCRCRCRAPRTRPQAAVGAALRRSASGDQRDAPSSVNFTALASRLRSTCWSRCASVVIVDGHVRARSRRRSSSPFSSACGPSACSTSPSTSASTTGAGVDVHPAGLDLGEVEDVVDQAQQVRARAVDRAGELDLPGGEVGVRVLGEQPRQQQQRVQRGAQLVAHVGQELGLVLAGLGELLGLLLHAAPGRVDLDVLDLDVAVLLGQLLGLLLQLGVGALQLGRLVLQLGGEPLALREQLLGAPVGLDGGQRDADGVDEPAEERQVQQRERRDRAELDDAEALALEQHGQHDDRAAAWPTRCPSGSSGSPRARRARA